LAAGRRRITPHRCRGTRVRVDRNHDQGDPLDVDGGQCVVVEMAVCLAQFDDPLEHLFVAPDHDQQKQPNGPLPRHEREQRGGCAAEHVDQWRRQRVESSPMAEQHEHDRAKQQRREHPGARQHGGNQPERGDRPPQGKADDELAAQGIDGRSGHLRLLLSEIRLM
jgi:hypothetical protein